MGSKAIRERLTRLRTHLVLDEPFFGGLLMRLPMVEDASIKPPTMCTNGRVLKYHPAFVDTLKDDELKGVLAHEVMHCALLHPWRIGDRNQKLANVAADYAVNDFLDTYINQRRQAGGCGISLPQGALIDHSLDNMAFEEIYAKLQREQPPGNGGNQSNNPSGGGQGSGQNPGQDPSQPGNSGGGSDPKDPNNWGQFEAGGGDDAEQSDDEGQWRVAMAQAAAQAKARGYLPAGLQQQLHELVNPRVPWQELLRRFVAARAKDDFTWRRPSKRFMAHGLYLPSTESQRLGTIVLAWDTSGSVVHRVAEFVSEGQGILDEARPEKMVCMDCDARVHNVWEFEPGDELKIITPCGGGGTRFGPMFEKVAELGLEPVCMVVLTDLDGEFPEQEPPYPVLWISTCAGQAPWGETVEMRD